MGRTSLHHLFAGLMLSVLLAACVGQQVHIYTEDPLHFAAYCDTAAAGSTDDGAFSARHDVDNFCFCLCLVGTVTPPGYRAVVLGVVEAFVTSCRCGAARQSILLRAPPVC